jgi:hypothetical protein
VIISTNEEGDPESEPVVLQAGAVDQTRIMVSWKPGLRNNGPIISYNLQIRDISYGYTAIQVHKTILYALPQNTLFDD